MKKKIVLISSLIICLSTFAAGTLAYFTDEEKAHNVITTGGVSIDIVEKTKDDSGVEVDFPEEGVDGVMPGRSVSKIVKVKNTGASDAWIRVKLETTITGSNGNELPLVTGEKEEPVMDYEILEGWIDGGDGYYYHEAIVAPEAFTSVLINDVVFNTAMENEYQNCTASLIVSAQAVQSDNNGGTVMEAKGWSKD